MTQALDGALPRDIQRHAEKILQSACARDLPLATAESCTGGLLAALLTDISGCSHIFECGFVVYSDKAKCDLLGLDPALVDERGAVSREVAVAMARGALRGSQAEVALAITGFAGPPSGDDSGEEGLVHFACARKEGRTAHREERFGAIGRDGVRTAALRVALEMIGHALEE